MIRLILLSLLLSGCIFSPDKSSKADPIVEEPPVVIVEPEPPIEPPFVVEPPPPVDHYVSLYWSMPTERVNGDFLPMDEIGGYEIRYKNSASTNWFFIILPDPSITQYIFNNAYLPSFEILQVAAYDTDGLYSDFVTAVDD